MELSSSSDPIATRSSELHTSPHPHPANGDDLRFHAHSSSMEAEPSADEDKLKQTQASSSFLCFPSAASMEYSCHPPALLSNAGLLQKVGAELISTYVLVFAGCGAAMVDEVSRGAVSHLGVSAAFGIVVMIMIYSVGHISGAHMNPAVTLAFATVRHFPWTHVMPYIGAQVVASIIASFSLRLILGHVAKIGATIPAGSDWQSLALEIILSFILMFVVSAVATDTRAIGELAGLAVGSAVGLDAIFGGPISGASMNPARSIGPAVASGDYSALWVYVVGPILGCLLGAWSYNMIRLPEKPGQITATRSFKSSRHG